MATSWSDRFLKKALMKIAETFPNWSASGAILKEGSFLVDEFWAPQTMSGLLYGDVIVKESIWNRYLGKIADPKEDFFFFGIMYSAVSSFTFFSSAAIFVSENGFINSCSLKL